jgi:hypothetical protein
MNYFCQLLSVQLVGGIRLTEIQTAEPFPQSYYVDFEQRRIVSAVEGTNFRMVPIHKKYDKTEYSNYWGISLLPTLYKILSNSRLSRLIPYADKVTGDH